MSILYQRSPRMKKSIESAQIEMLKPPEGPSRPVFSPLLFVWPSLLTVITVGVIIYLNITADKLGSHFTMYEGIALIVVLLTYTLPFAMYWARNRDFDQKQKERELKYSTILDKYKEEFETKASQQRELLLSVHRHPELAVDIVSERSAALWERSAGDADFLEVRAGTGSVPFHVEIKAPRKNEFVDDPLVDQAIGMQERYQYVPDCPVTLPLIEGGIIGLVGNGEEVRSLVRALIAQVTINHSPDEVKLAAFIGETEREHWDWMRYFPHLWNEGKDRRFIAANPIQIRELAEWLYQQLGPRIARQERSYGQVQKVDQPYYITLLTQDRLIEDEALYALLMNQEEGLNASVLVLADSTENLPRQCKLIVECKGTNAAYIFRKEDGVAVTQQMTVDRISLQQMDSLARRMAPIELKKSSAGEIPSALTLLELLGIKQLSDYDIAASWERNRFPQMLPVPLGVKAGGKTMHLQLHDKIERQGHGPHGLIAGTTGSGKSELLQSLVGSVAMEYHPHDVNFLLIDYKGGGMSNVLEAFPHVVGSLTNLDKQMIHRAKVSLRAELVRRQQILKDAGNLQHIDEYYLLQTGEPLPHLIVMIDEFAELKRDHPDFMDELISIAAIGRTLGLHLILATQKPSGVVDDKIWSNARFRICLRVQEESDSRDMLKVPDAAWITKSGRGYFQVGSGEVFEQLQFAWSSAPYLVEGKAPAEIFKLGLSGERVPLVLNESLPVSSAHHTSKQLQEVIRSVQQTAENLGITPLVGPWLPPLPEQIGPLEIYDEVENKEGLSAVVGLADDITGQQQLPLQIELDDGHLLIYGMPGSGKTTFIQTLIMSLAKRYSPESWVGYVVDMGRTMKEFASLPHIGNVITPEDQDRVSRLFRYLLLTSNERRQQFVQAGVKTAAEYRRSVNPQLPEIVVVIDDYYLFKGSFPAENEKLDLILREGAAAGIRVILSANRVGDILEKLRSSIPRCIAFQIADPGDYYYMGLRAAGGADIQQPPGRGHVKWESRVLEFQGSLPSPGENEIERAELLRYQIFELDRSWRGPRPEPIRELPVALTLDEVVQECVHSGIRAPLGIRVEDLKPFGADLELGPHFLVGAPMEAGKTLFLTSWLLSLAWNYPPEQLEIYTVDNRHSTNELAGLQGIPHIKGNCFGDKGLAEMVDKLFDHQGDVSDSVGMSYSPRATKLLMIDDADLLARQMQDFTLKDKLTGLIRKSRELGVHVIISGVPSDFPTFGVDWFTEIRNCQSGFLLGSRDANDLSFFRIPMSETQAGNGELPVLPPGQGYYVRRKYDKIKAALPFTNIEAKEEWINKIGEKWKVLVGEEVG
ncbi:type VII secretion protein EssC [Paenibacillus zeisoli]|uniref:Type VII secretion protein EssC n=1 Tax=Paenibacillus zeisoli TaxID=2496267 RepID=A0A433X721_9BACL|nr:type VII secretion protein EssC [Paenibacillus zeisoli]RUT29825.1 type VII secretion protein EssC [Paenibacillus zeisoli]